MIHIAQCTNIDKMVDEYLFSKEAMEKWHRDQQNYQTLQQAYWRALMGWGQNWGISASDVRRRIEELREEVDG